MTIIGAPVKAGHLARFHTRCSEGNGCNTQSLRANRRIVPVARDAHDEVRIKGPQRGLGSGSRFVCLGGGSCRQLERQGIGCQDLAAEATRLVDQQRGLQVNGQVRAVS